MARNTVAEDRGDCDGMNMMAILDHLEAMGPDAAIAIDKRWKEKRKQSKGVNFGYVYGMGATKFCEYAKLKYEWDVSHQESSDIRDGFFATYSSLPLWHDRQRSMVKIDGFVRSLSGRKRRLPGVWSPDRMVKSEAERQAINSPVQGFIGDLKVMGMLSIYNNLQAPDLGAKLRIKGEVHDSILMWVRNEHLDEMLPKIKQCMEQPEWLAQFGIELPVPIVADIEVGTWGAGKTWKGQKYNA
jgi:DNA polymerase-1